MTALLFFFWVTLVLPLYYRHGYFDILQAKGACLNAGTLLTLCAAALSILLAVPKPRCAQPKGTGVWDLPDLLLGGLGALAVVSSLLSDAPAVSFWGTQGYCTGALAWFGFGVIGILLAKYLPLRHSLWLPAALVNSLVFLLSVLHSAGVDVLSLHEHVDPEQYFWYLSTIGNLNWFMGYLCLIVPMYAVFFLNCTTGFAKTVNLLVLLPAMPCLVLCASDGIFVGMGVAAFFAIPYVTSSAQRLTRTLLLSGMYGLSLVLVGVLPAFAQKAMDISGLSGIVLNSCAGWVLLLLSAVLLPLAHRHWDSLSPAVRHRTVLVLELLLLAVVLCFFGHTLLTFKKSWGHNRGRIWRYSVKKYRRNDLKTKLIGYGPEMLTGKYRNLRKHAPRPITTAHSEPLQVLLTMGAAGTLVWTALWGWVFVTGIRRKIWRSDRIAYYLPLAAYWGQALVISPQPVNLGLLCVILAFFRRCCAEPEDNPPDPEQVVDI